MADRLNRVRKQMIKMVLKLIINLNLTVPETNCTLILCTNNHRPSNAIRPRDISPPRLMEWKEEEDDDEDEDPDEVSCKIVFLLDFVNK